MRPSKRHGGFQKLDFLAFCYQDFFINLARSFFKKNEICINNMLSHFLVGKNFNIEIFVGRPFPIQMKIP